MQKPIQQSLNVCDVANISNVFQVPEEVRKFFLTLMCKNDLSELHPDFHEAETNRLLKCAFDMYKQKQLQKEQQKQLEEMVKEAREKRQLLNEQIKMIQKDFAVFLENSAYSVSPETFIHPPPID
jgi:uncharacterized protein YbgA (DUF1722 family)